MGPFNTDWAWPWWTVIVSINAINLVICAILFVRSRNTAKEGDPIYRKRMRIMGLIFAIAVELSFSGLIALTLLQVNRDMPGDGREAPGGFRSFLIK